MTAIISLLVILTLSLAITRVATVALTLTGISRELARFQARSAFSGVGFATAEAEQVVNHPVRRRIIMLLMLMGNIGIVTFVASTVLSFVNTTGPVNMIWRVSWLLAGITILWLISTSKWIDAHLSTLVGWALKRWTHIDVRDYAQVLHLSGEHGIIELYVEPQDWLAGKSLVELALADEGVLVLGIQRAGGKYIGAPKGQTKILPYDTVTLYGCSPVFAALDKRRSGPEGDQAHQHAVVEHQRALHEQLERDEVETEIALE